VRKYASIYNTYTSITNKPPSAKRRGKSRWRARGKGGGTRNDGGCERTRERERRAGRNTDGGRQRRGRVIIPLSGTANSARYLTSARARARARERVFTKRRIW